MDSRFHGVPISAAQMAPKAAAPSLKGIRAPLTVDESDFEYSFVSKSVRNGSASSYYSGSEVESEGFESGEDERETVPERAHVGGKNEDILEKTHFVKEFAFSEPWERTPDEEFGRRSGNISGNAVSKSEVFESGKDERETVSKRARVVEKDGEFLEETHFVKEFAFAEPSVRSADEEFGQKSGSVSGNAAFRPIVRIPDKRMYGVSDVDDSDGYVDESDGSGSLMSESDDELVKDESYVIRYSDSSPVVPLKDEEVLGNGSLQVVDTGNSMLQNLDIPTAKISAYSDDDSQVSGVSDEEGFSMIVRVPSIEVLRRVDSVKVRISESNEEDDNKVHAENIGEMEIVEVFIRNAVLGQDKAIANSLVVNEEFDSTLERGQDADPLHLDKEIQESNAIDEQKKYVELVDHRQPVDFVDDIMVSENISGHGNQSEKVESESKGEIVLTSESFSSNAAHEISSVSHCADIKEVPAERCSEFSQSPESESMQVYTSDSISIDGSLIGVIEASESVFEGSVLDQETMKEDEISDLSSAEVEESTFHSNKAVVAETKTLSSSNGEILLDHSEDIDGQIVADFFEEVDTDAGMSGRTPFLEAVKGTVFDGMDNLSLDSNSDHLSSLNSPRSIIAARDSHNFLPPSTSCELEEALTERDKKKIEKIQHIRVNYLRLLHTLGRSSEDSIASKVLYLLSLAEPGSSSGAFHFNFAKKAAMELAAQRDEDFDFSLSILVIGKTGVGKSSTLNSIFGERKAVTDAFEPSTTHVKEIVDMVDRIKIKVFDTPGLRSSLLDQSINRKILTSIKKLMRKNPPDIILYVDRLDTQTSLTDLPLLKSVTSHLGSSIWRKSIIAFTHGTSIPLDGPSGHPLSYEAFVAHQSRIVRQLISHSAEELLLLNAGSMVPVCLVENHPFAEKNGYGETVLLHGESWRSQLLLLCYSVKILSELSSVMIPNPSDHGGNSPVLSYFLSSFLQLNDHPKLSSDPGGENDVPDMAVRPSFDGDDPSFRYRHLEKPYWLLTSPVLDSHGWDHDCGFSGVLVEDKTDIANQFPAVISVQLSKDKKEFTIQLHSSVSAKHGDNTTKFAWTVKGETRIKKFKINKKGAGVSATSVGEYVAAGLKVEDRFAIGRQLFLVGNAGFIRSHDDSAYGVSLDLCRRDEDHPTVQDQTSLGLSVTRHRDNIICGCSLQSQFSVGRNFKLNVTAAMDNNSSGQICIKTRSSDQLHIAAALALAPIARALFRKMLREPSQDYST